jgi:23S rRNA (cytosine1962-C5)-methyltransferase
MTPCVVLKQGREESPLKRHPWIYSGAIDRIAGDPSDGDLVSVLDHSGRFLAWGYLNRRSQIAVRLLSWDTHERIDTRFWRDRLARAFAGRAQHFSTADSQDRQSETTAYRLVNAESDGIPGLIVDRYGDWLVAQFLTIGVDVRKEEFVRLLEELSPETAGTYERSDVAVRAREGLPPAVGPLRGPSPPAEVLIVENGLRFAADLKAGHKTGFYLDQRENREALEAFSAGVELLDCFSYTGAFSVYAARAGAHQITNVETSTEALQLARRNMELNGFDGRGDEYVEADVFQQLRSYRDSGRQFDLIVLDPPKFAHSRRVVKQAARGYKDINWLAIRLLRPGGVLFSFSCSAAVSADLFQKILFGAALDAGREVQIIGRLAQSADHPVLLSFPQSDYLKGLICRVW